MPLLLLTLLLTAEPGISILTPGSHHGREVKKPGQGWLGLFATKLTPVTVKTKKVHDPIDDEGRPDSVTSGLQLSVEGEEQPLVFLKGLAPARCHRFRSPRAAPSTTGSRCRWPQRPSRPWPARGSPTGSC